MKGDGREVGRKGGGSKKGKGGKKEVELTRVGKVGNEESCGGVRVVVIFLLLSIVRLLPLVALLGSDGTARHFGRGRGKGEEGGGGGRRGGG